MTNDEIKALALSCGFTERPQENGEMDLNPYVYEFARKLMLKSYDKNVIGLMLCTLISLLVVAYCWSNGINAPIWYISLGIGIGLCVAIFTTVICDKE